MTPPSRDPGALPGAMAVGSETPRSSRVSGRSGRFLRVLQDLGHLDDDALMGVLFDAASRAEGPMLPPDVVRREAARWLFLRDGGRPDGAVGADWSVLFS